MYNYFNKNIYSEYFYLRIGGIRVSASSLFSFFIALSCSLYLTSAPIDVFPDRQNYLDYAEWRSLEYFLTIGDQPSWVLLFSEPVWHIINISLGYLFPKEVVVRLIIFFPAFALYFIALKYFSSRASFGLALIFIFFSLHPIYLSNHFHHLRFALALSAFVLAFNVKSYYFKYILLLSAPLIHVSFFVYLLLSLFGVISDKFRNKIFILSFLVILLSVMMVFFLGQAENIAITQLQRYSEREIDVGGGMFFVMLSIFILMASEGKWFAREHIVAFSFLGLYLASYWVFPYSRRFLDAGLWFVLVAGLSLSRIRRYAFISVFGAIVAEFLIRTIHMPYFGYAYDWYYD